MVQESFYQKINEFEMDEQRKSAIFQQEIKDVLRSNLGHFEYTSKEVNRVITDIEQKSKHYLSEQQISDLVEERINEKYQDFARSYDTTMDTKTEFVLNLVLAKIEEHHSNITMENLNEQKSIVMNAISDIQKNMQGIKDTMNNNFRENYNEIQNVSENNYHKIIKINNNLAEQSKVQKELTEKLSQFQSEMENLKSDIDHKLSHEFEENMTVTEIFKKLTAKQVYF